MPRPNKTSREFVLPNRLKLRSLRDQYMRDAEAVSYDEIRNKFLQELKSKRGSDEARHPPAKRGQRERGAGIWNNAFARKGRMLRSSIILLAEFFAVTPEELILTRADDSSSTQEVKTMSDTPIEPVMESLMAYSQRSPTLDIQARSLCQQLIEYLQRHLQRPFSEIIGGGQPSEVAGLREALLQLSRVEPSVHTLVLRLAKMSAPAERPPSSVSNPVFNGDHSYNQVFSPQGDVHLPTGSIFNNQNTFNMYSGKKGGNGSSNS